MSIITLSKLIHAPVLLNLLNSLQKSDRMLGKPQILLLSPTSLINPIEHEHSCTVPRSAVGNVSGNRCESDCKSRGREFDPGPVPYFRGD